MNLNREAKQSVGLIILQIVSILVGIFTTFFVAAKIPADIFAIIGIYTIITSIISVFSNSGLETYAGRNVLNWLCQGKYDLISKIITQAVATRICVAILLVFPTLIYTYYISKYKFDGMYLCLFNLMCICSVMQAANDSICLILKSFNKYLLSAFITYSVTIFGRVIAIILFLKFGFNGYIFTVLFIPFVVTIPVFISMRKWFSINAIKNINDWKNNIKENRFFTLSAYMRFGIKQLDLFLVSFFLPTEIIGTFSLIKKFQNITNGFIANIFDPYLQKCVQYKDNITILLKRIKNITRLQNILLIVSFIMWTISIPFTKFILDKFGLNNYPHIYSFLLFMLLGEIIIIAYKVKFGLINYFCTPKKNFTLYLLNGTFLIISFLLMQLFNIDYLFFYTVLGNFMLLIYVLFSVSSKNKFESFFLIKKKTNH